MRVTCVAPVVADQWAGSRDDSQMLFSNELQKATQIAARVRVAVEIEFRIADLVPVPGDAKVDRIDANSR